MNGPPLTKELLDEVADFLEDAQGGYTSISRELEWRQERDRLIQRLRAASTEGVDWKQRYDELLRDREMP